MAIGRTDSRLIRYFSIVLKFLYATVSKLIPKAFGIQTVETVVASIRKNC